MEPSQVWSIQEKYSDFEGVCCVAPPLEKGAVWACRADAASSVPSVRMKNVCRIASEVSGYCPVFFLGDGDDAAVAPV